MIQLFFKKIHLESFAPAYLWVKGIFFFLSGFIFQKSNHGWYLLKVLGSYPGILVRAISLLLRLIIMASESDGYSQISEIESGLHYDIQIHIQNSREF